MKKLISIAIVLATLACMCSFNVSAVTISGLKDSGIDYKESTRYIDNPMLGYSQTVGMRPKVSGNSVPSISNPSGFVFFYVDLQNFAAGYQLNDKGLRIPLTDVQRADRTDSSKAHDLHKWNNNQRNHGGAEDISISEDALQMLRDTFQKLRDNGGTGYVRFNYAINAEVYNEPYDFKTMLEHIEQVSEVITEYCDVIGAVECGMIGPFGEMHSSPYCAAEYANQIIDTYLKNTPENVKLLIRTPRYIMNYLCYKSSGNAGQVILKDGTKRAVQDAGNNRFSTLVPFDNIEGIEQADMQRLSLYNDGYMLTGNDTGTWTNRETGVEWLSWAAFYNYYGGEYGSGTRSSDFWLPETALPEMYQTHVSYIRGNIYRSNMGEASKWSTSMNKTKEEAEAYVEKVYQDSLTISDDDPYKKVLDKTKVTIEDNGKTTFTEIGYDVFPFTEELAKQTCKADVSAYYGFSCHTFMKDHLGYRFVIRSSKLSGEVDRGGVLQIQTSIENTGMGNCIQAKTSQLIIAKDGEEVATIDLNKRVDANSWYSQETSDITIEMRLSTELAAGDYDAYLRICNVKSDGTPNTNTCVEFANEAENYSKTLKANYLGSFKVTDKVSALGNEEYKQVATVFDDVDSGFWGKDQITEICTLGLMSGTNQTSFAPNATTTRGMLVQVLYNLEGRPDVSDVQTPFTDIGTSEWYTDAVKWAYKNEIVFGTTKTTFAPNGTILREQFAAFLFRYAKYKEEDTTKQADLSKFTDVDKTSTYALPALEWANAQGYITGHANTTLIDPTGNATRAQMASILARYINNTKA